MAFTFFIALLTGVFFGLAPALRASRVDLNEVLKEGGRSGASSRSGHRTRKLLVVFEIAVSLLVRIGAGLLTRSYRRALMLIRASIHTMFFP